MIHITCDNCDTPLEVADDLAGTKYPCPECGDINRIPSPKPAPAPAESAPEPKPQPEPEPSSQTQSIDKAAAAGFPPDHGPEVRVRKVRRCWFKSRPGRFAAAVFALLLSATGLVYALALDHSNWWLLLAAPGAAISTGLLAWWWIDRYSAALIITTKRTTMQNGFFRRSTSEVVHDNIRNVQVDQTFWQRVWKVGKIGISSSGQDGVEVQVNHLPGPDKLREIIDLYRPL